uniref:Uncharacterized protein n=1 Tax=Anguilla anguilla TaxID=7936 RepID=A0A0E9XMK8_ANGAN
MSSQLLRGQSLC